MTEVDSESLTICSTLKHETQFLITFVLNIQHEGKRELSAGGL